ncbi:tetratricopeptide repeat protein [Ruegeria sp. AD91A]|uniref:tetratricopeptide repeat protein n=1 Tax=Ruegeria sp. AD91A TaxID=2293862 RepID=UPI0013C2A78B|nr:SEL1-like repeat protein [Ruegeria sp. AD91A]
MTVDKNRLSVGFQIRSLFLKCYGSLRGFASHVADIITVSVVISFFAGLAVAYFPALYERSLDSVCKWDGVFEHYGPCKLRANEEKLRKANKLLFEQGRGNEALALFQQLSEDDHPIAIGMVAFIKGTGFSGLERDLDAAREIAKSVRNELATGEPENGQQLFLQATIEHFLDGDPELSLENFIKLREAASRGFSHASYVVAVQYFNGGAVKASRDRFFDNMLVAAEAEHVLAMEAIGDAFRNGIGTDPSPSSARKWYERASTAGSSTSQRKIGEMVAEGLIGEGGLGASVSIFEVAGSMGDALSSVLAERIKFDLGLTDEPSEVILKKLSEFADQEIAEANFLLGHVWLNGYLTNSKQTFDIERDPKLAATYFERSLPTSNNAHVFLAEIYSGMHSSTTVDFALAAEHAQKCIDSSSKYSMGCKALLAWLNLEGLGVPKDIGKAEALAREEYEAGGVFGAVTLSNAIKVRAGENDKSANQERLTVLLDAIEKVPTHAHAHLHLAWLYELGPPGIQHNQELAYEHFRISADYGIPVASCNTGFCLLKGNGTEKDVAAAIPYLEAAAREGLVPPLKHLFEVLETESGHDLTRDRLYQIRDEGLERLKSKALQSACTANALGKRYEKGELLESIDLSEANRWYEVSATLGSLSGKYNYGRLNTGHIFERRNPGDGLRALEDAVELGSAEAALWLAYLYLNGDIVDEDEVTAKSWLNEAEELGAAIDDQLILSELPSSWVLAFQGRVMGCDGSISERDLLEDVTGIASLSE